MWGKQLWSIRCTDHWFTLCAAVNSIRLCARCYDQSDAYRASSFNREKRKERWSSLLLFRIRFIMARHQLCSEVQEPTALHSLKGRRDQYFNRHLNSNEFFLLSHTISKWQSLLLIDVFDQCRLLLVPFVFIAKYIYNSTPDSTMAVGVYYRVLSCCTAHPSTDDNGISGDECNKLETADVFGKGISW